MPQIMTSLDAKYMWTFDLFERLAPGDVPCIGSRYAVRAAGFGGGARETAMRLVIGAGGKRGVGGRRRWVLVPGRGKFVTS